MFLFKEYRNHAVLVGFRGNDQIVKIPAFYNQKPVTEIAPRVFAFSSIEEVVLPNRLEVIGIGAFENCYKLKNIAVPPSLRTIEHMAFSGSRISTFTSDTEDLTLEAKAFSDTYSLTKFALPNAKHLVLGSSTFLRSSIETFDAPFATVPVIEDHTFAYCSSLKKLNLKFHCVEEYAFYCCRNLMGFDIKKLTYADSTAFSGCPNLQKR